MFPSLEILDIYIYLHIADPPPLGAKYNYGCICRHEARNAGVYLDFTLSGEGQITRNRRATLVTEKIRVCSHNCIS